jgi:hypothetical protein
MVTETIVLTAPEYPSAKGHVLPLPPLQPWLPEERLRAEVDWGYDPNRQARVPMLSPQTLPPMLDEQRFRFPPGKHLHLTGSQATLTDI